MTVKKKKSKFRYRRLGTVKIRDFAEAEKSAKCREIKEIRFEVVKFYQIERKIAYKFNKIETILLSLA